MTDQTWQSIKTVPRDGTWFRARTERGTERVVRFDAPDDRYPISGDGAVWSTAPVEWMPLPSDLVAALAREAALREAVVFATEQRATAFLRRNMNAPEDPHVEALCERYGYGAVMDAASRLWARKDGSGAFYIGGCIGYKTDDEARAALAALAEHEEKGK
jgi:hypothetical protein